MQQLFSHIRGDDFDVVVGADSDRLKIPLPVSVVTGCVNGFSAFLFGDFKTEFITKKSQQKNSAVTVGVLSENEFRQYYFIIYYSKIQ